MTPEEQLKVLSKIWGNKRRSGRVIMPWWAHDENGHRAGGMVNRGVAFRWPQDKDKILEHLRVHTGDELFFTPMQFTRTRRWREEVIDQEQDVLFADLDDFPGSSYEHPRDIPIEYKPTAVWETSPGKYQAVWLMMRGTYKEGMCDPGEENQRLVYHLGGDTNGWPSNKVLRVPGSVNRKPEYVNDGRPYTGSMVWQPNEGPTYIPTAFAELPEVTTRETAHGLIPELLESQDARQLRMEFSTRIPSDTRRKLRDREWREKGETDQNGNDRSTVMYGMAMDLAKAGANLIQIIAMLRESGWNKHQGLHDEITPLTALAEKVLGELPDDHKPSEVSDGESAPTGLGLDSAFGWLTQPERDVKWLIEDVWQVGACGWMAAAPKSFKSWFAFDMATAVATGKQWLSKFDVKTPGAAMIIEEEDPERRVKKRFRAIVKGSYPEYHPIQVTVKNGQVWAEASAERPHPLHIRVGDGFRISSEASLEWLQEMIEQHELKLVVIDTLYSTLGADMETKQGEQMMSKALRPLRELAQAYNCAIMVIHHNRKGTEGSGRPAYNMAGSSAMHGWADAGIYFGERTSNQITFYLENKDSDQEGGVTVDISSLNRTDPRKRPYAHVDSYIDPDDGQRVLVREPVGELAWAPYVVDDTEEAPEGDADGSTPAPRGNDRTRNLPGSTLAAEMSALRATTPKTGRTMRDLQNVLTTKSGATHRPSALQRQLDNGVEAGVLGMYDNEGKWKKPRYYALV